MSDPKQPRFVVLHHQAGPQLTRQCDAHFDWMFQIGDTLRTWATEPLANFQHPIHVACESLSDHRLVYLDYEGEIDGDRGCVTRVLAGRFRLDDDGPLRFVAQLYWDDQRGSHEAQVKIYRSFLPGDRCCVDDSRDDLRLRFSPGR